MADRPQVFQLEQLSLALSSGNLSGAGQLLGRSPAIRPDHLVECRRAATLTPLPLDQRTDAMPGAFGLFRGETVDYILAKAQQRPGQPPLLQFALVPGAVMRTLGGNLRPLHAFAIAPITAEARGDLPPITVADAALPDADMQMADLLELLDVCKNRIKTVSGLLSGVIQGMGLAVVNAPPVIAERLRFLQGLLTLLPAPARIAITFASGVIDPAQTTAQIKFLVNAAEPERHVIFDWATGAVRNEPPEDTYTHFIIAQLRLDTSLVIAETEKLARTAVWRAMRRENMASALAWASKRASLDKAVEEGLPADRGMVAAVLREDPTLPDDLRVVYARHLLRLSLALGDATHTDILPALAVQNKDVADAIYEQLFAAAGGDNPMAVYRLVENWIAQAPMGVDVSRWRPLVGMAALARVNKLMAAPATEVTEFLRGFLEAPPALQLEHVMAQVIGQVRRRGYDSPDVAREVFLLAAKYAPLGGLQRLLSDQQFVFQLPVAVRAAIDGLVPQPKTLPPAGLLAYAAETFDLQYQGTVLRQFVEWALSLPRLDLIDAPVLRALVRMAASAQGDALDVLAQHVLQDLSALNVVRNLDPDSQRYLVELCLVRRRFADAERQIVFYQDMLYQSTRQDTLYDIARVAFQEAPLDVRTLLQALDSMAHGNLKPVTAAQVNIGALEAHEWNAELEPAARNMTALLYDDPRLIASIGLGPAMRLLRANAERKDDVEALRAAHAIVSYLLMFDEHGADVVEQVFGQVSWNPEVSLEGLEVVRNYVRRAPLEKAATTPRLLGRRFGDPVRIALEGTYRMRLIAGGADFNEFAERVAIAAALFTDMALYFEGRDAPSMMKLRRSVDSMSGGLSEVERERLSRNLSSLAELIMRLYNPHQAKYRGRSRADNDTRKMAIVKNRTAPGTALEALTWIGGFLGNGEVIAFNPNREAPAYLLGTRSVNMLLRETDLIGQLFAGLLAAFPEGVTLDIDRHIWMAEVRSLWGMLTLYQQRNIQHQVVDDLQILAQVLVLIGDRGNERNLQDSGFGRQLYQGRAQPRTALDSLRWLSGYFAQEHSRPPSR